MPSNNFTFWAMRNENIPDLLCGKQADYFATKEHFPMLICGIIVLGGVLRVILHNSEVFVLMVLSISGFVIGQLAYNFVEVHQVVYPLLTTQSFSLYSYFLPLMVFVAALDVDFYVVKNVFWQVLLTGTISLCTAFIIIGYVVMKFNQDLWDMECGLLFSITLCIIDPLHSVNSLTPIGISKMYADIIRGESLIICSFVCIFFGILRSESSQISVFKEFHLIIGLIFDIFGSITCGYWCSRVIQIILTDVFNNTLTNLVLCYSLVYMTYYLVEYFGMSGIVALATIGLNLDSLSFKPRMEFIITKFLMMCASIYEHLIYALFGIVVGCGNIKYFRFHSFVFIFILFITVNIVRLVTVILVSPILMHASYEYNWQWGLVITWTGIRGVFSLILAPDIYNFAVRKVPAPHMFIFYIQIISLLTMGINSYMMIRSARLLGLCIISLPRQMAMQNAIQHIQQIIRNTITLYKTEKILTNVNWNIVEEKAKIEYNPTEFLKFSHISHDKDSTATDEVLIEEARLHVAIIQMSSFEKQCNDGILGIEAARILIGATKSYCPIQGKFMSISDVSSYVKARNWIVKFKAILTFLEYHRESPPFISPRSNRFLLFVHHIIFTEEFEYAVHVINIIHFYSMIIHICPLSRELNVSAMLATNFYFMLLYAVEVILKILILKRKYFLQYWNTLDFVIVVTGIIDMLCIHFVRKKPKNLSLIQFTVVMGYLRVIRFLPIFKIIIPVLINIADVQVKKSLSLMYTITKGYVKSQEDAKLLIRQISGRDSVYQTLNEILEKNKEDAIKGLGRIEHEGRDVVIALKTKQAIRNVIAKALKNLTFLRSRGIIDKHEGIEMNKVLLKKIKALNNFPMAIPPPTPDNYLPNIIWMENKDAFIEFFKVRARLTYFDYGDVICREGEMPQGIYLIISGMARLHSSSPTFGIDSSLREDREIKTPYTEYCSSGDILGELSCLLKREVEYTAICETTLQAFFISMEDLYEGIDVFWPSLEYRIWLKFALGIANQYFEPSLAGEDLSFQSCVTQSRVSVETLSSYNEMTLNNVTMKFVIVVYGNVINSKTYDLYVAPCIIPKTCEQIQGIADISKLLIILAADSSKSDSISQGIVSTGLRTTKKDYNWKKKDEL